MRRKVYSLAILVFLLTMSVMAGCSNGGSKTEDQARVNNEKIGVYNDKIVIGAHMGISGPAAVVVEQFKAGMETAVKQVNEKGGINGRKIELIVQDDGYNPAQALAAAKKLIDRDNVFAITGAGTPSVMGALDYINQAKVPYLFPMAGQHNMLNSKAGNDLPNVFMAYPDYQTQIYLLTKYLAANKRSTKFAILFQNDIAGEDCRAGLKQALNEIGLIPVAEQGFETSSTDYSAQVQKVMNSGAEVVILGSGLKQATLIVKEADKQGFKPVFVGHNSLVDANYVKLLGPLAEGTYAVNLVDEETSTDPNVQEFLTQFKRYFPDYAPSAINMYAYSIMMTIADAIKQAGPSPTREGLVKAIEGWKNHPTKLMGTLTFGPGAYDGKQSVYPLQVKDGKFVKVGDWLELKK